jgi:SSS family solute:Na+ symporter
MLPICDLGSIIYNDIVAPFRKKNWNEKKGLFWNRTIIALIVLFLLVYGLWYRIEGDLWTYLGITGTIYLSSISVLLIACCYWEKANNWGAGAAIAVGALVPVLTLVLQKIVPTLWFQRYDPAAVSPLLCSWLCMDADRCSRQSSNAAG